jgi:AcrR family transcriptional regulator
MTAGLRERKKAETRRALERAALKLFSRRGYDEVTVEEIADAAKVSPRTFFRYFSTKEEVILGPQIEMLEHLEAELARRPHDEPVLESVRQSLHTLAVFFEDVKDTLLLRFELMSQGSLAAKAAAHMNDWVEVIARYVAGRLEVEVHDDLRPYVVAAMAGAAMHAARSHWMAGGGEADLPQLVDQAFDLMEQTLSR